MLTKGLANAGLSALVFWWTQTPRSFMSGVAGGADRMHIYVKQCIIRIGVSLRRYKGSYWHYTNLQILSVARRGRFSPPRRRPKRLIHRFPPPSPGFTAYPQRGPGNGICIPRRSRSSRAVVYITRVDGHLDIGRGSGNYFLQLVASQKGIFLRRCRPQHPSPSFNSLANYLFVV